MKKIYLSLLVCSSFFVKAQDVILYEQAINGTSGVVSSFRTLDPQAGVWCADDFTLSAGGTINKISVSGFSNSGDQMDAGIQGFDLYIFADNNGAPAGSTVLADSWLLFQNFSTTSNGYAYNVVDNVRIFTLDLQAIGSSFVASPNVKYWLVVSPRISLDFMANGGLRWNWYQAGAPEGTSNAHISSSGGLFNLPAGEWQNFSAVGLTFFNLAMRLEGSEALSSESFMLNEVKVYPNPTKGVVNIKLSNEINIDNISLTNSLGKKLNVSLTNDQIDISDLPTGIYFLKISTNQGSLTRKIVKE